MSVHIGQSYRHPFTILVSDDDPGVRRSTQLMLRAQGFRVRAYTSGSALLADPRSLHADCLVVDFRMPDIDGLSLLERLRAKGWCGCAIMISAYHDDALEREARRVGFEHVISKPLIARALLEAIACSARDHG